MLRFSEQPHLIRAYPVLQAVLIWRRCCSMKLSAKLSQITTTHSKNLNILEAFSQILLLSANLSNLLIASSKIPLNF